VVISGGVSLLAGEAFNPTFNKPTGGEITRQVQLGFRVDF